MFPHSDKVEQMLHYLTSSTSPPFPLPMEQRLTNSHSNSRWKSHIEIAPNCPRCASTNTKFCYYNNYSLSQPRYFCKGCRRYWTKGGSLRNVPVGGGCRKTRRGKSATRNHQNDRVSSNSSEDNIGIGHQNESRDIDMAVVFAKFLNQNPSSGGEDQFESSSNNNNNLSTTTPESVENDTVVQQPEKVHDVDAGGTVEIGGDQELISLSGIDEFDGFLGSVDEDHHVVQNVSNFWCDDHAIVSSSSTATWQPPPLMQMQLPGEFDLEYSSSTTVNNLLSDSWSSWSSFDLSTMEVFSSTSTP